MSVSNKGVNQEDLNSLNIFKKKRPNSTVKKKINNPCVVNTQDNKTTSKKTRQNKNKLISWTPFPPKDGHDFSSQQMFLSLDHIDEILYTGSRFIGKSDALIAAYLKHVGKGFGEAWVGVLVRVTNKGLRDLIKKAKKIIFATWGTDQVKFLAGDQMLFKWKTGEVLSFRQCANEKDYEEKFHGQEYPFIGIDELTSYADSTVYTSLLSCNRAPEYDDAPNVPIMMRATTNPSGKGKNWVKEYFIDPEPMGTIIEDEVEYDGDIYTSKRVAINGHWSENPYAPMSYITKLFKLEKTDYPKFRAWLFGDWDVVLGGMFGDLWRPQNHMVTPFTIPSSFRVDKSYDDGSKDPFSVLFWAECDRDRTMNINGKDVLVPEGSLFLVGEIYGSDKKDPNKGLYLPTKQIAKQIVDAETRLLNGGLLNNHGYVAAGPADYMIWKNQKIKGFRTIAQQFKDNGVRFTKAKKHGDASRKAGVRIFQDMLLAAREEDTANPHIYIFNTCRNFISNVINLQRDDKNPDDIDQTQPDHDWDACRYRITKKTTKVNINY